MEVVFVAPGCAGNSLTAKTLRSFSIADSSAKKSAACTYEAEILPMQVKRAVENGNGIPHTDLLSGVQMKENRRKSPSHISRYHWSEANEAMLVPSVAF